MQNGSYSISNKCIPGYGYIIYAYQEINGVGIIIYILSMVVEFGI